MSILGFELRNVSAYPVEVPHAFFADIIFDLELAPKLKKRMSEKGKAVKVKIEEL